MINHSIQQYDNWYWAEVSGRIEYLFEHMNGYPIPNVYAEEILKKVSHYLTMEFIIVEVLETVMSLLQKLFMVSKIKIYLIRLKKNVSKDIFNL